MALENYEVVRVWQMNKRKFNYFYLSDTISRLRSNSPTPYIADNSATPPQVD